jgi:hypothetical protein
MSLGSAWNVKIAVTKNLITFLDEDDNFFFKYYGFRLLRLFISR